MSTTETRPPLSDEDRESFRRYALENEAESDGTQSQWADYVLRLIDERETLSSRLEAAEKKNAEQLTDAANRIAFLLTQFEDFRALAFRFVPSETHPNGETWRSVAEEAERQVRDCVVGDPFSSNMAQQSHSTHIAYLQQRLSRICEALAVADPYTALARIADLQSRELTAQALDDVLTRFALPLHRRQELSGAILSARGRR